MADISSHRQLIVWQKAMDLVVACYQLSAKFPDAERFGLTSQLRRAAVSVPANIAEGKGRGTSNEYRQFVTIARGSTTELDTLVEAALRLKLVTAQDCAVTFGLLDEVGKMLTKLRQSLER